MQMQLLKAVLQVAVPSELTVPSHLFNSQDLGAPQLGVGVEVGEVESVDVLNVVDGIDEGLSVAVSSSLSVASNAGT